MKNKAHKLVSLASALILLGGLMPSPLRADNATRGIGGTGHTTATSGLGGTGNSINKEGIGGTGHTGTPVGIGGTGAMASKTGIGGTGHSDGSGGIGGTGIVGIVTGFGSIWVNGLEVQYDAKTQVSDNAAAINTDALAIGDVVVIEAKGNDESLQADKISVINAVAGQISAADAASGRLTVLGQSVISTPQTITHDPLLQQDGIRLQQGDYIKVSGLRTANGEIVASRIERTAPFAEPSLVGPVTGIDANLVTVYGLQISTTAAANLRLGQEITAIGKMEGAQLAARQIAPSPSTQLYGRTEHINLQGYVGPRGAEGQIKVGNMEVVVRDPSVAPAEKLDALAAGELIQVSGHFANEGRVIADRIEFSRDRPDRSMHDSAGYRGTAERGEHGDHSDHLDRADHNDHIERTDRGDHSDHADRPDRPDRTDHSDAEKHSDHSH